MCSFLLTLIQMSKFKRSSLSSEMTSNHLKTFGLKSSQFNQAQPFHNMDLVNLKVDIQVHHQKAVHQISFKTSILKLLNSLTTSKCSCNKNSKMTYNNKFQVVAQILASVQTTLNYQKTERRANRALMNHLMRFKLKMLEPKWLTSLKNNQ